MKNFEEQKLRQTVEVGTALFIPEAAGSPPSSPKLSTANEGSGLAVWEGRKKEDFLTPAGLPANSLGEGEKGGERRGATEEHM